MSGHTFSPTHVARIALAGAVIGLGALAAAGQANAEPVAPPLPTPVPGETPAPGTARDGSPGERASRCAGTTTGRGTARAGGREPPVRAGEQAGAVGLPAGCLASGPGPVRIHRYAAWPDARSGPTPAGSRSGAAAAARVHIADRPGVQRTSANGVIRGRAASAAWLLPVERATAARVLRPASRARPGCATAARAGSTDALAAPSTPAPGSPRVRTARSRSGRRPPPGSKGSRTRSRARASA